MASLLKGGPAPMFIAGSAEAKAAAKSQNLGYPGGAITAPLGVLDYFFDLPDDNANYCRADEIAVARGGYSRTRVIGLPSHTVSSASYTIKKYPFVEDQTGQAGLEMTIEDAQTGGSWVLRRRGSMQSLIAALCGGDLTPARTFYLRSARGRTYGPFVTPGASVLP